MKILYFSNLIARSIMFLLQKVRIKRFLLSNLPCFWKNRHSKAQIWTSERYKCNNAHSGVFLRHSLQKREEVSRADWACSLNPPWRDRDYKKKWCGNISTVGRVETAAHGPMDLNIRVKARAGWHKYDAIWTGKKGLWRKR